MSGPRVRDAAPAEAEAIRRLVTTAFRTAPHASGTEAQIVDRLRAAGALALSLVAQLDDAAVGHVAASAVRIGDAAGWFGIGPLAVLPGVRSRGIGAALMKTALARLRAQGAVGAVLVGAPDYYGRFGFAADPRVGVPGIAPDHVLVLPFGPHGAQGQVRYHPAFGIDAD